MVIRDGKGAPGKLLCQFNDPAHVRPDGVVSKQDVRCARICQHLTLRDRGRFVFGHTTFQPQLNDLLHLMSLAVRSQATRTFGHDQHAIKVGQQPFTKDDERRTGDGGKFGRRDCGKRE